MKKYSAAFVLSLSFLVVFFSCKKINESTTLGGDLIPAVDNVNTFEISMDVQSNNALFNDSSKLVFTDQVALGAINDPDFGRTETNVYFNISSSVYGTYPFIIQKQFASNPDSLKIDSVVLSLAYAGAYGDTNSHQTVHVKEVAQQTPGLNDTTLYAFNSNLQPDFQTVGSELASKSFFIRDLNDSVTFIRKKDTSKTVNVLRIPFNPASAEALGRRFAGFDTSFSANSGFRNDSIFKSLFRGLAITADQAVDNGGLAYFNLTSTDTKLTIYFRATKNGIVDTSSLDFTHTTNGQANIIHRHNNGAPFLASLNAGSSVPIYMQSAPGSYTAIKIPGLDTLRNKVIHRAELIATRIPAIPAPLDNIFYPPSRLIVDRLNKTRDTAFTLQNDLSTNIDGSINFDVFGGTFGSDNTYRFNISRHVQGIITRKEPNDTLRLYAPLRTTLFASNLGTLVSVPVINRIAEGRVVLAGGVYAPNPAARLRLRIIYSNL